MITDELTAKYTGIRTFSPREDAAPRATLVVTSFARRISDSAAATADAAAPDDVTVLPPVLPVLPPVPPADALVEGRGDTSDDADDVAAVAPETRPLDDAAVAAEPSLTAVVAAAPDFGDSAAEFVPARFVPVATFDLTVAAADVPDIPALAAAPAPEAAAPGSPSFAAAAAVGDPGVLVETPATAPVAESTADAEAVAVAVAEATGSGVTATSSPPPRPNVNQRPTAAAASAAVTLSPLPPPVFAPLDAPDDWPATGALVLPAGVDADAAPRATGDCPEASLALGFLDVFDD